MTEHGQIIIALVSDVQARFTNVSTRQWNLWVSSTMVSG